MKTIGFYVERLKKCGAERVTLYLSEYFANHGYQVCIITSTRDDKEYIIPGGVRHINVGTRNIFKMRKVLRNIDMLVVMGVPFCLFTIPACFFLKMKTVVSERNAPAQFSGKRVTKILSRFLMRFADGYVFQTSEAKQFYNKMLHGKGEVIFNPLESSNLPLSTPEQQTKTIVNVGRLSPQKNQALLISAFNAIKEEYPDYNVVIYGDGGEKHSLEEQIKNSGLENRVNLAGNVYDVHERIKNAAVFVFTSNYEGMPNALIEAMAMGLPCISTDCPCGGPRELIVNGENGILIPVGDESSLVNALRSLLDDNELRIKIGKKAIEIRDRLDASVICKQWEDYLNYVYDE